MKAEQSVDEKTGGVRSFHIEMIYISLRDVGRVLRDVPEVTDVQVRPLFVRGWDEEVRVRFRYKGRHCIVIEPYGDNSQYWIIPDDAANGPEPEGQSQLDFAEILRAFEAYRPPLLRRWLGDILTLEVFYRFARRIRQASSRPRPR